MQDYPVSLLKRALETYSPSGSETDLSNLLLEEMHAHGLRARTDDVGNVIGETGNEGPRILLCGHLDTVPGLLPVYQRDGFIYGRGAVDAKSSLAAMFLGCLTATSRNLIPFRATVAGVIEEETTSKGIKSIASSHTSYDMAVFGEPSGTSDLTIGYKGSLRLSITCRSPGGHSSSPWLSENSLEKAFEFWNALREKILDNGAASKFGALTGSLVNASSSPGGNSIPKTASFEIDVRIPPGTTPRELILKIEQFKTSYASGDSKTQIDLVFTNETTPFLGKTDSLAVRAFRYAIRKVTHNEVSLVRKTGTSDMNVLAEFSHAPMVAYGPGDSMLDHTDLEKVSLQEYYQSIEVYATAIEKFAMLSARPLATVGA